jgi:hypothetical protein
MGKKADATIMAEVVQVTYTYLGPAADRFVSRQVRNHLGKNPEELCKEDLAQLMDWFILAMGHLSEDSSMVVKYAAELRSIGE